MADDQSQMLNRKSKIINQKSRYDLAHDPTVSRGLSDHLQTHVQEGEHGQLP
jgi:hypothetical protein